jgi:hypothetical protein
MLCAPNNKVEACPLNFPETAFYQNGVCVELFKTDHETGLL